MGKLGVVLYEYLGEEYPEVLGSILGALRSIVTVVGINSMQPPIKDLLPRLTPILRNRHEKVQENTIDLVGRIADRGAEFVSAREWMRICFELLDMLKAHKKGIRRAANNTFGKQSIPIYTRVVINLQFRFHCQSHRSPRRSCDPTQQSPCPGTSVPCLYCRRYRYCR